MGMPKHAKKRDANEKEIVDALRAVGAWVHPLDIFDLLVCFRGRWHAIEVKRDFSATKAKNQTAISQAALRSTIEAHGERIHVVTSTDAALRAIGAIE